jgi:hypothetical protein
MLPLLLMLLQQHWQQQQRGCNAGSHRVVMVTNKGKGKEEYALVLRLSTP